MSPPLRPSTDCHSSYSDGRSMETGVGRTFHPSSMGDRCFMRAMAFTWSLILVGGIVYFSIIGLTHH